MIMRDRAKGAAIATLFTLAFCAAAVAQSGNDQPADVNAQRTNQQQGGAAPLMPNSKGLGVNGIDRTNDIRRTATGDLNFSDQQLREIRDAAAKARLERQEDIAFTVAVGAAVPQQAGARDLPKEVAAAAGTAAPLSYVLARDSLVLIDKKTTRIIAIIPGVS